MKTQQVCIECPSCSDCIILPRRGHLWASDDEPSPSEDVWPIDFLCLLCGKLSPISTEAVRLKDAETQNEYHLVRYDFTSDESGLLHNVAVYTKEPKGESPSATESIERVLEPTGLWGASFEKSIQVSRDAGATRLVPTAAHKRKDNSFGDPKGV